MSKFGSILAVLAVAVVAFGACPQFDSLRTQYVVDNFDPAKMTGVWYEAAYIDLGQTGASCPQFNRTIQSNGLIQEQFVAKYLGIATNLSFYWNNSGEVGLYKKWIQFSPMTPLDAVIVDVTPSEDSNEYVTVTEFICGTLLGVQVTEVRFSYRKPMIDPVLMATLEERARAAGMPFGTLTYPDYTNCGY